MFSKSQKKVKRSFFSLIELLIVIGIMGVLTALILPQFSAVEADSKDTGCDYNNAGTLRYVSMFKAANGKYPTGFHTGLDSSGNVYDIGDDDPGIDPTAANMYNCSTAGAGEALSSDAATNYLGSLKAAGIVTLAQGDSAATSIASIPVIQITKNWSEDAESTATDGVISAVTVPTTNVLSFNGQDFETIVSASGPGGKAGILVPLFAASTVDWDAYYDEDGNEIDESKVGIALPGKCPWPEDGKLRYYICFFKAFADGSPAKLVGTACPECGPLHASTF